MFSPQKRLALFYEIYYNRNRIPAYYVMIPGFSPERKERNS